MSGSYYLEYHQDDTGDVSARAVASNKNLDPSSMRNHGSALQDQRRKKHAINIPERVHQEQLLSDRAFTAKTKHI